jgi:hypothetical protein
MNVSQITLSAQDIQGALEQLGIKLKQKKPNRSYATNLGIWLHNKKTTLK